MSSTTDIKFQYELEDLLADNTTKAISAQDVRTIVTSNYQPVLIFAGRIYSDDVTGLSTDILRVQYYNQEYFGSNFTNNSTSPWIIESNGSGITNGTYENVQLVQNAWNGTNMNNIGGNSTNATFDVTVTNGSVTSVTLKAPGSGWIGKTSGPTIAGQTGDLDINGNQSASLRFNGPLIMNSQSGGLLDFNMSTDTTNGNHTIINSIISSSAASKRSAASNRETVVTLANASNDEIAVNNKLYVEHWEAGCYVQIWRVAQ